MPILLSPLLQSKTGREAPGDALPSPFPLQLLALLFIAVQSHVPEQRKRKEEVDGHVGESSKYDLVFRRGDLLEVPRTLFTHFGIYLGGDR